MTMRNTDFAVFILSHGRADRVDTYDTLRNRNYTGRVYIVIDNEDKTAPEYYARYGAQVLQFDKLAIAQTFDTGDNFSDRRTVVYARNACFDLARQVGVTYFMELDDDYTEVRYRMDDESNYTTKGHVKNLDWLLDLLLDYYKSIPQCRSLAIAQGGDFIGGNNSAILKNPLHKRKCMNTFICSTERPFQFVGRVNEDVNTYVWYQGLGNLFLTFPAVGIEQRPTQSNSGGMTEMYLSSGTYVKSFYTVMYAPSCTLVRSMGFTERRLHHAIKWNDAVPVIIAERYRKSDTYG